MDRHTLAHALSPADTGCRHDMKDIHNCVICGADLTMPRKHVDTCGERCFKTLCAKQRGG